MNETIEIQPNEVGRMKMPVPVTGFAGLAMAFEQAYGPGLRVRQHGCWAIVVTPEPEEPTDAAQGVPTNEPGAD